LKKIERDGRKVLQEEWEGWVGRVWEGRRVGWLRWLMKDSSRRGRDWRGG
jgi:hypothetical protein